MEYKIRKANEEELEELKEWFYNKGEFDRFSYDSETVEHLVSNYYYVVIENYISDCPAYVGKLMLCVWGMPEFRQAFIWDKNDKITECKLDEQFLQKEDTPPRFAINFFNDPMRETV